MTARVLAVSCAAALSCWAVLLLRVDRVMLVGEATLGPLPLAFWAVFLASAWLLARLSGARSSPASVVAAGAVAHLGALLAALRATDTGAYGAYVSVAQVSLVGAAITLAARRARGGDAVWLVPVWTAALGALGAAADGRIAPLAGALVGVGLAFASRVSLPSRVATLARDDRVIVAAAVAVALVARLLFGARLVALTGADFPIASSDGPDYDAAAWGLASGTLGSDPGARWPRGYWTFVAGVYRLFGHSYLALALVQGALCAVLPAVTFVAARAVFGRATAVVAAWLVALSGTLIFTGVVLGTEGVYALAAVAAIALLLAGGRRDVAAVGAGACLGLAIAVKPQTLPFALFALGWLALARSRRAAALGMLGLVFALAPVVAADVGALGRVAVFGAGGPDAFNSAVGKAWRAIGVDPYRDGWPAATAVALAHPLAVLGVLADQLPRGLSKYLFGDWFGTFDPVLLDRLSDYARTARLYGVGLVAVGAVAALRADRERAPHLLLWAFVLSQVAAPLLLGLPQVRYRVPSDPILVAYLAFGATILARRSRLSSEPWRIGRPGSLSVGGGTATSS